MLLIKQLSDDNCDVSAMCFHVTGIREQWKDNFQFQLFYNFEILKQNPGICVSESNFCENFFFERESDFKEVQSGGSGERGAGGGSWGGAEWWREQCSFRALKRRRRERKRNPPATVQELTRGRQGVTGWAIVHFLAQGDTLRKSPSRRSNVRLTRGSRQEGLKLVALFMVTKRIF